MMREQICNDIQFQSSYILINNQVPYRSYNHSLLAHAMRQFNNYGGIHKKMNMYNQDEDEDDNDVGEEENFFE